MKRPREKGTYHSLMCIFFLSILAQITLQQSFSSLVQLIDGPEINQLSTYRFTLFSTTGVISSFNAGTKFKTYFPSTVAPQSVNLAGGISVCRIYFS